MSTLTAKIPRIVLLILLTSEIQSQSYFRGDSPLSWTDAKLYCQNQQTTLASIHSESQFNEATLICQPHLECWTGLNDIDQEGIWNWDDGSVTDYGFNNSNADPTTGIHPWQRWGNVKEPNNGHWKEDCVEIIYNGNLQGEWKWNDKSCTDWELIPICNTVPSQVQLSFFDPK